MVLRWDKSQAQELGFVTGENLTDWSGVADDRAWRYDTTGRRSSSRGMTVVGPIADALFSENAARTLNQNA
jgi:hypothetical protein